MRLPESMTWNQTTSCPARCSNRQKQTDASFYPSGNVLISFEFMFWHKQQSGKTGKTKSRVPFRVVGPQTLTRLWYLRCRVINTDSTWAPGSKKTKHEHVMWNHMTPQKIKRASTGGVLRSEKQFTPFRSGAPKRFLIPWSNSLCSEK